MNSIDVVKLLQELQDTKLVKVTGSYADGTYTHASDVDFYVKPDKPDTQMSERNMLQIIAILNRHGIKWHSTRTGYISTIGEPNPLPAELEFADCFVHRKNRLSSVKIAGVAFKTY